MRLWNAAALALLLLAPGASAYNGGDSGTGGMHTSTSLGPRVDFYKPDDADHGAWTPGVQMRLHMAPAYALELSGDFAHYTSGGTNVRTDVVQATVLGYFAPDSSLSPYLLIGAGWYPTHADGPYNPSRLFGPHVGGGLELLLGSNWSIDGSYRFLWTEIVDWAHVQNVLGAGFGVRGHMFTLALNYRL
jgi:opacity protein-like surface antigen